VIRIVHVEETRSAGFPVWASKPVVRFVSGMASKPLGRFLVWASKPMSMVWPQNHCDGLVIWASKSPQRFLGLDLKTKGRRFVGCASKSTSG
jgi:hypothetical protein